MTPAGKTITGVIAGLCFGMSWISAFTEPGLSARVGWGVAGVLAILHIVSHDPQEKG